MEWAGERVARTLWAGRLRNMPQRDTTAYARLFNIGGWNTSDKRPLIKPTPTNLRMFAKTPYARRAIRRIKDAIGNLEWEVAPEKDVKLNSELKRQIDVTTSCLKQPNLDDSFRSFVEQLVEDMMVGGAGPYEHQLGGDKARPLWMWPVDVLSIQINAAWDGRPTEPRYYQTKGYGNIGGIQGVPLRNDELVYIRMEPTTENPFGLGPLEVAFASINRKLGVEDYAGKLASNAQPENLITLPGATAEQILTIRDWWRNEIEGQGMTPIMGTPSGQGQNSKAEVLKLRGTDDKALFLAYQELLIREVAVSFSISALCLGIERDVNRNTGEVTDDMDWDNAVVPVATRLAAYITRESIHGRLGFSQLQFNFLGLKRDDKKAEAEIYKLEYESNATTPNEYRARNRQPPLDSPWSDLTHADVEIAQMAARGAAEVDDPALPAGRSSGKPKSKSKE